MFRLHRTPILAFVGLLLACWAYWPGLRGGFLFDDYPNLKVLGAYGRIDNAATFWRYITSGFADPTGRPLAMLSFLIDARNWPADPYPFKRTNLILHLFNGLLLFAAMTELGRALSLGSRRARKAAILAAGLWLLHPLFVSTVLYIVQREAMLPATFAFATLWMWLVMRRRLLAGRRHAIWGMAAIVVLGTLLSTLSKANGVLLPALLLVVESCLPDSSATAVPDGTDLVRTTISRTNMDHAAADLRKARRWLLWLPTVGLFAMMIASIPGSIAAAVADRPWTLGQRMLTEPRVLFDYLGQLWLPRPFSRGLFNDDYIVSHGLFDPWTTLPSLLGLIALAIIAWGSRKRAPSIAIAIGFYLVGQSIESGPVPLEIYFEHRNYLPAALMFWPLALWLTGTSVLPRMRSVLAIGLPLLLAALTWIRASLWGDPTQQAFIWGIQNSDSPRAQAYAAQYEIGLGHADLAERRLRNALRSHPMDIQLQVNLVGARCALGNLPADDLNTTAEAFAQAPDPTTLSFIWLEEKALPVAETGSCKGLDIAEVDRLVRAFANNPRTALLPGRQSDADHLLGQVALAEGNPSAARAEFDQAYAAEHRIDIVLVQAAMLAGAHQPALALGHLALGSTKVAKPWYRWRSMPDVNDWVLYRQRFWQQQIDELRGKIQDDLKNPQ